MTWQSLLIFIVGYLVANLAIREIQEWKIRRARRKRSAAHDAARARWKTSDDEARKNLERAHRKLAKIKDDLKWEGDL